MTQLLELYFLVSSPSPSPFPFPPSRLPAFPLSNVALAGYPCDKTLFAQFNER
jgi:hypothetical protein